MSDIVKHLRAGICDDKCRIMNAVGGCLCAMAADSIEGQRAERERLYDKIDGLSADLDNAVETAFKRGATEWTRLNYPEQFARLSAIRQQEKP